MATLRRSTRILPMKEGGIEIDSDSSSFEISAKEEKTRRKRSNVQRAVATDTDSEDEEDVDMDTEEDADNSDVEPAQPKLRRSAPVRTESSSKKQYDSKWKPKSRSSSFVTLSKKVLFQGETSENSLLAALLQAKCVSSLAAQTIEEYAKDSNSVIVSLLNLLFRSIGATPDACLDASDTDIRNLGDDDWQEILGFVFETMEQVPINHVLLQSDATKNKAFRTRYETFYFSLVKEAMQECDGISAQQIECVKTLMESLIVLTCVGQPDMRLGATMAVYSMSKAILETTKDLNKKIESGRRHLQVAKRNKSQIKSNTLTREISLWTEASEELSQMIVETMMSAVFMKRCRDSDPHIRVYSLETLSEFCLIRPDIFIAGRHLKYMGWFMYDKDNEVRHAALQGLLTPLQAMEKKLITADSNRVVPVINKFLKQIVALVLDVAFPNQEKAMELLLLLLRDGFLDSVDDAQMWSQVNARALAAETTALVRKNALYFVMAQCEPFDEDDHDSSVHTEKRSIDQINALATWAAVLLANRDIPVSFIRYELVDFMVQSLHAMEEYRFLATSWSAMLKAFQSDEPCADPRLETVKQRVILRMLVCAAELRNNAGPIETFSKAASTDPDLLKLEEERAKKLGIPSKAQNKNKKVSIYHEEDFSDVLATALPKLFMKFKGDTHVLRELTRLPMFFRVDAFDIPSQKKNYTALVQSLSQQFLELTDSEILSNCASVLAAFASVNHTRTSEASVQVRKLACSLCARTVDLIVKKRDQRKRDRKSSDKCDLASSISLCLQRLAILSKRLDISDLLDDESRAKDNTNIRQLWRHVSIDLELELDARAIKVNEAADNSPDVPDIWNVEDDKLHSFVLDSLKYGLEFFYLSFTWRLSSQLRMILESTGADEETETHSEEDILLYMRDQLVKLVLKCFDQDLDFDEYEEGTFSEAHIAFVTNIQVQASQVAGNIALLLPKWMRDAKNHDLRRLSDFEEKTGLLNAGLLRFIYTMDGTLKSKAEEDPEDTTLSRSMLMPLMRAVIADILYAPNQPMGAAIVRHCTEYGESAASIALDLTKVAKKLDPLLCLKIQFRALQEAFEAWCAAEPAMLDDMPTEEEHERYEQEVKQHTTMMHELVAKARRLASVLGVGTIRDRTILSALQKLIESGVKYVFHSKSDLPAGARLPFLRVLTTFITRLKGDKVAMAEVEALLNEKEAELRETPDYADLLEFDLDSILEFRKAGAFEPFNPISEPRLMRGGLVVSSPESKDSRATSSSHSLSPVPEEMDEETAHPIPENFPTSNFASQKRQSLESPLKTSTKRIKSNVSGLTVSTNNTRRTLRGTQLSTVASPLSSDSIFEKNSFGSKRRVDSFGKESRSSSGATVSSRSTSYPSRKGFSALSQSTIGYLESVEE